jgi:hypothetical protein
MAAVEASAEVRAALDRRADRYTVMAAGYRNPARVTMAPEFAAYDRYFLATVEGPVTATPSTPTRSRGSSERTIG